MPYYLNPVHTGLSLVSSAGDGYKIGLRWNRAYPRNKTNKIAYNIYYATTDGYVFLEGPKFVSISQATHADILDLVPGQLYHFAVRAVEYDPNVVDPTQLLDVYDGLKVYPESVLVENMTSTDLIVPLLSTETFPSFGVVQAGVELINYLANDTVNNQLVVAGGALPQNSRLALQSDGYYYTAGIGNKGTGTLNNLQVISSLAPSETWTIKCVFVQRDNFGAIIPRSAKFEAFGSLSESARTPGGSPFVWDVYGTVLSNGILSFGIQEISTFALGDTFSCQVLGATIGTSGRGYNDTFATEHLMDGYDGYLHWSPYIRYSLGEEEINSIIFQCQNRFDIRHEQFSLVNGYHQVTKDLLTTDLSASDALNVTFPSYDYAGYHRTDPVELLNGACVGSYIGGSQYCADGYNGVGRMLRGLSFQQQNDQRQEMLLSLTGEPVCLVKRVWTGITCSCYLPSSEYPDDRCPKCYGTKFVIGWDQYFNPRRSDGRIMVRFSPADDDLKPYEGGLESEMIADVWTLTVPTVKDRDFIVRFDEDGNEEFRYEILSVNRNRTLSQLEGAQKFRVQRVRKFDPIYSVPVFRNTQYFPSTIMSGVGSGLGLPDHTHTVQLSETSTTLNINELTGISMGHNHPILKSGTLVNGIVLTQATIMPVLGHSHPLIIPTPPIITQ